METTVEITDLVVERGRREVLHGITAQIPRGLVTGLLGQRQQQDHPAAHHRRVQVVKSGTVTVLGQPAGSPALRLPSATTQAPASTPTGRPGTCGISPRCTGWARTRPADHPGGRPRRPGRATGDDPLRGQHSRASLACALVSRPEVLVLRADRQAGPAATGRAVAPLPRPRPRQHHPAGLQPRHGRGEPVRPAAADPGQEHHRRRHPEAIKAAAGTDDLAQAFLRLVRQQVEVA